MMTIRSLGANLALILGTDESKMILHHPTDTKFYVTDQDEASNIDAPAGQSNQTSMMDKDREIEEFHDSFSSRAELQYLISTELRNLESFELKGAMMQGHGKTLAEAKETGLFSADSAYSTHYFHSSRQIYPTSHIMDE